MNELTRRGFVGRLATMTACAYGFQAARPSRGSIRGSNDRLQVAVIGAGNRGRSNWTGVRDAGAELVAFCDVDDRFLEAACKEVPGATRYSDFRRLLDDQANRLDAVVVSTADHTHAAATVAALRNGLDVYCEKPLTHNVEEARIVAQTAAETGAITQMGTQIHAGSNYRRVVEAIRAGSIGTVREVHVWVGKGWGGQGTPTEAEPIPSHLNWDLWLGPAPRRAYHSTYHPINWRRWWDFGGGTLADMACHYMDLPFWALNLTSPTRIEAFGPSVDPQTAPEGLTVRYAFPAPGDRASLDLFWYDGPNQPQLLLDDDRLPKWGSGVLFVGDEGLLIAGYTRHEVFLNDPKATYEPPAPSIAESVGHHREWVQACLERGETTCHFGYAGRLTETVLLGIVSYRTGSPLEWDAESLRAGNCPEAEAYIAPPRRRGWDLEKPESLATSNSQR